MHASVWPSFVEGWLERCVITMQLFAIFSACDNWPVMFGQEGALGSILTHLVLGYSGYARAVADRPATGVMIEYVSPDLRSRISNTGEALSMKKNG